MCLCLSMELLKLLKPVECWERRDSLLMLLTLPCCKELSRLTTPSLISSTYHGFLITSTGDSTRDIMALWRAWIKLRLRKSTAKIKFLFGEDLMIFHHRSLALMTKGIQDLLNNILICQPTPFHALSHWRSLLIECFLSGMTLSAQLFSITRTLLWLPMVTLWEPSTST